MKDKENLTKCLSARLKWYDKAIAMKQGAIPYENGFDFPDGDVSAWRGAVKELKNTLDMLSAMKKATVEEQREKTALCAAPKWYGSIRTFRDCIWSRAAISERIIAMTVCGSTVSKQTASPARSGSIRIAAIRD